MPRKHSDPRPCAAFPSAAIAGNRSTQTTSNTVIIKIDLAVIASFS
jgi:hypothetical protein